MNAMMLLAHLLGDYVLQFNCIARWKARSVWGVVAHGGVVTLCSLVCAALLLPAWWPYALFIGATHTAIDVIRARLIRSKNATQDLTYYLLDQGLHVAIIFFTVQWSGVIVSPRPFGMLRGATTLGLTFAIGYILLLQPAWVLLRFLVRGVWGTEAAPQLGIGEKYGPMLERVAIASLVFAGQFYLVPVVLLPRRVASVSVQGNGIGVLMRLTTHWAETFLSVLLAVLVGLTLRLLITIQ